MSLLFWRRKKDEDLDDEIESHLKMAVRERVERGESSAQAEVSARREMGNVGLVKEVTRDVWGWRWAADAAQDVRYGLRMLRKSSGFTAVAVLTLALGIGANAAIFSILDPLLLRKLPVQNPDQLVLVHGAGSMESLDILESLAFVLFRDNNHVFSGVMADGGSPQVQTTANGQTSVAHGDLVSGNYFTVLGVRPFVGRLFVADDDRTAVGSPVVVLSFDYWKNAYNADVAAVGKIITIGNLPYTIVGVTPPEFFGMFVGKSPDFYLPVGNPPKDWVAVFGRLKPGVTQPQAQADLDPIFRQAMKQSTLPEVEKPQDLARLVLTPAARGLSDLRTEFSLPARILMAVVALVLLIACANVANLLLARGASRRKEITVRLALGAGRLRLVRQLVTESALLALMGAAVGLLAASWAGNLLVASLSTSRVHVALTAGLSFRVLGFTGAILALTVFLCGLLPAMSATRGELAQDLKVQTSGNGRTASRSWVARLPMVTQVALSVTLLTGAGLLLHSLVNLETFDAGFNRDNVLTVSLNGSAAGRTSQQAQNFYDQLVARIRNLPGVKSAGLSAYSPATGVGVGVNVAVEGYTPHPGDDSHVFFTAITPGYFETLGIPLIAGRDFAPEDSPDAPSSAVINRTMARHYFGEDNPIGRQFSFVEGNWKPMEIIGVVADSKYVNLREHTPDYIYLNRVQFARRHPANVGVAIGGLLDVRVNGNAKMLAGPIREIIRSLDSSVKITDIKTVREQVDETLHQDRLIATLCGIFSLLALTLTCVGLYGTLSFSVVRRTNEIGVRMALGARPGNIFGLVIGQGMRLVIVGLVIGAAGALASASLLAKLLFGVKGADPVTFIGVSVVLIVAAILACYLPARRAMRVDPMVALRDE
jgi:predicted permease